MRTTPTVQVGARMARSSCEHGHAHLLHGNPRIAAESFCLSMRHSGIRGNVSVFWVMAMIKQVLRGAVIRRLGGSVGAFLKWQSVKCRKQNSCLVEKRSYAFDVLSTTLALAFAP